MKRISFLLLQLLLLAALCACGGEGAGEASPSGTVDTTEEAAESDGYPNAFPEEDDTIVLPRVEF